MLGVLTTAKTKAHVGRRVGALFVSGLILKPQSFE